MAEYLKILSFISGNETEEYKISILNFYSSKIQKQ
jgi:hypothetical protein